MSYLSAMPASLIAEIQIGSPGRQAPSNNRVRYTTLGGWANKQNNTKVVYKQDTLCTWVQGEISCVSTYIQDTKYTYTYVYTYQDQVCRLQILSLLKPKTPCYHAKI